jgi:hypothetical protein
MRGNPARAYGHAKFGGARTVGGVAGTEESAMSMLGPDGPSMGPRLGREGPHVASHTATAHALHDEALLHDANVTPRPSVPAWAWVVAVAAVVVIVVLIAS